MSMATVIYIINLKKMNMIINTIMRRKKFQNPKGNLANLSIKTRMALNQLKPLLLPSKKSRMITTKKKRKNRLKKVPSSRAIKISR